MKESDIARINELYKKSKNEGLTDIEKAEQQKLRTEYIKAIRSDLKSTLNNVSIKNPDGTIEDLKNKNVK